MSEEMNNGFTASEVQDFANRFSDILGNHPVNANEYYQLLSNYKKLKIELITLVLKGQVDE